MEKKLNERLMDFVEQVSQGLSNVLTVSPALVTPEGFLLFADEGDGDSGAGSGTGGGTADDQDNDNPDEDNPDENEDKDSDDDGSKGPYSGLTEAELRALVRDRDSKLAATRSEAAQRRIELKKYKDDEDKAKKAKMGELERAQAELGETKAELEKASAELRKLKVQSAVAGHEVKVKKQVFVLIDPTDFSLPEDKEIEEIPELLNDLFSKKPHFFKAVNPDNSEGDGGNGTPHNQPKGGGNKEQKPLKFKRTF